MLKLDPHKEYTLRLNIMPHNGKRKDVYWHGKKLKHNAYYRMDGLSWWMVGLTASGYATSETYADKLRRIINEYKLDKI